MSIKHLSKLSLAMPLILLAAGSCAPVATATFTLRVDVEVAASSLATTPDLVEDTKDGKVIKRVACEMNACAIDEVPVVCDEGFCNPEPQVLSGTVGDVVDVNQTVEGLDAFAFVDSIEIVSAKYQVTRNTLTVAPSPIEVFWGPKGAVDTNAAMGVERLSTLPALQAEETSSGELVLDQAGVQALTTHLSEADGKFRFLYRTAVDLEPGQAFPTGNLGLTLSFEVTASGELL